MKILGRNDLRVLAEVEKSEERFPIICSNNAEDMGVAKINRDLAGLSMEIGQGFSLFDQFLQLLENTIFHGADFMAVFSSFPVEERSMNPPSFQRFCRVEKIALIIQRRAKNLSRDRFIFQRHIVYRWFSGGRSTDYNGCILRLLPF